MTDPHGTPESHDERDDAPDSHGHDEHGHGDVLGPIDWSMWAVGAIGVVVALVVTLGFVVATGFDFRA